MLYSPSADLSGHAWAGSVSYINKRVEGQPWLKKKFKKQLQERKRADKLVEAPGRTPQLP